MARAGNVWIDVANNRIKCVGCGESIPLPPSGLLSARIQLAVIHAFVRQHLPCEDKMPKLAEDERYMLVTRRVGDTPDGVPVLPGSSLGECGICHHAVLYEPKAVRSLGGMDHVDMTCMQCAGEQISRYEGVSADVIEATRKFSGNISKLLPTSKRKQ